MPDGGVEVAGADRLEIAPGDGLVRWTSGRRSLRGEYVPGMPRRRELGRGERVIPGLWRLRLPLPLPGVPHCNAWAIAAGDGVVLVDTGMHEPDSMAELERALAQVGLRLEHVRLLVCTHAHSTIGARPRRSATGPGASSGCIPTIEHGMQTATDPDVALARRLEIGRQSGVPEEALARVAERVREMPSGIAR